MSLSNEILFRIQECRKPNPNAPKKIIYFVGPSACGKTTKVKTLEKKLGGYYQYITLDGFSSNLSDQPKIFLRNLVDILTLSERLINAIKTAAKTHQNTIFVDGHPILSVLQCEAMYKLYNGKVITEKQLNLIRGNYVEIVNYFKHNQMFTDFQQTVYYINIPLEINLKLLLNQKKCEEISSDIKNELVSSRKIIHSSIFDLVYQFDNTRVIEVNTLQGLDIIHTYLLGSSGCC